MRKSKPSKRFVKYGKPELHPFAHHDFSRVVPAARSGERSPTRLSPVGSAKPTPAKRRLLGLLPPKKGNATAAKKSANLSANLSPSKLGRGVPPVANGEKSLSFANSRGGHAPSELIRRAKQRLQLAGVSVDDAPMAKGSYGTIFLGKLGGQSGDAGALLKTATSRVGDPKDVPPRAALAIKVQVVAGASDLRNVEREARIHAYVARRAPLIAPKFYFAGYFANTHTYVTVMEFVDGRGLCSTPALGSRQFLTLEKMIGMLWRLRVFHGDLHCGNILVPKRGGFKIIDFGRAVVLPGSIAPKTAVNAMRPEVQDAMQVYAARVVAKRARGGNAGYMVMNGYVPVPNRVQYADDVHALRVLYSRMDKVHRARLRPGVSAPRAGRAPNVPKSLASAAAPRGGAESARDMLREPLWPRARAGPRTPSRRSSKSS